MDEKRNKMIIERETGLAKDISKKGKKHNAFFGISIFNKFFTKDVFEEYAKWCSERFQETIIILMDDVESINFQIFKKLPQKEAKKRAWKRGDELKIAFERRLRKNNIQNIQIVLLRDFLKEIQPYLKIIREEYKTSKVFKENFKELIWEIIGHKIEEFLEEVDENLLDRLSEFLKVELAALFYLTEKGYKIELDPTPEFSIKKDVYEGRLNNLKEKMGLKSERGHIYLHPKGKEYGKINKQKQEK